MKSVAWPRAHPPLALSSFFCKAASPHPNGPPALAHPWADVTSRATSPPVAKSRTASTPSTSTGRGSSQWLLHWRVPPGDESSIQATPKPHRKWRLRSRVLSPEKIKPFKTFHTRRTRLAESGEFQQSRINFCEFKKLHTSRNSSKNLL